MVRDHEVPPWREPIRGGYPDASMSRLSGVDQLRALIGSGVSPPIGRLVGMALTDVALGGASFSMPATRWLLSPQGVISCGTLAILADGPLGCAVHSALPPATTYSTSELSLRLLRPARAGGMLVARARVVHAGSLARAVGGADHRRPGPPARGRQLAVLHPIDGGRARRRPLPCRCASRRTDACRRPRSLRASGGWSGPQTAGLGADERPADPPGPDRGRSATPAHPLPHRAGTDRGRAA